MNFFAENRIPLEGTELFETLYRNAAVAIERIASNSVQEGEWYDQDHDEWVILIQGWARLEYEDNMLKELYAGDHLFIPSHTRHRVLQTSCDALWLAVHLKQGAFS